MVASLLLPLGGASVSVKVHPVVLLQICDAYIRRKEDQERVIGSLLGSSIDGQVEVKSCYVVPHNESADQVAVDIVHHKTMYDLHLKVSPAEQLVGWFSTGAQIGSSDALIQDFYTKEPAQGANTIHLVVDPTLQADKFGHQAYVSRSLTLGNKPLATEFVEVPCDVVFADVERVGADMLVSGSSATRALSDQDNLATSVERLHDLLGVARAYVADVVAGKRKGDPAIGRYLADSLAVVPALAPAEFESLFNEGVQVHLYDVSHGMATRLAPLLLNREVDGLFHATVVFGGVEYSWGPQLTRSFPGQNPRLRSPDRVLDIGATMLPPPLREELLASLAASSFNPATYDLVTNNCTHFSHELCTALTGNGLPEWLRSQLADIVATPMGEALLKLLAGEVTPDEARTMWQEWGPLLQDILGTAMTDGAEGPWPWRAWFGGGMMGGGRMSGGDPRGGCSRSSGGGGGGGGCRGRWRTGGGCGCTWRGRRCGGCGHKDGAEGVAAGEQGKGDGAETSVQGGVRGAAAPIPDATARPDAACPAGDAAQSSDGAAADMMAGLAVEAGEAGGDGAPSAPPPGAGAAPMAS